MLHSVMAAGCVNRLITKQWDRWILSGCLMAKLALEKYATQELSSSAPVIVDAHLFGALGGAAIAVAVAAGVAIIRR